MNIQEQYFIVDNKRVNYFEVGIKERPTIICLHGLVGSSIYSFKKLIVLLSNNFHVIAIDQPGHGRSSPFGTEDEYSFSNLAKWYEQIIPSITQKQYYILGHSWGADVALHIAKNDPGNVTGVILLDGGFTFPEFQEEATFSRMYHGWSYYMDHTTFQSWDEVLKGFEQYTKQPINNYAEEIQSILYFQEDRYELVASKFTVLSVIKAFYAEPFSATYPHINKPLLLLHATQPVNLDDARSKGIKEMKKHIKDVTITPIRDSGHMVQWDESGLVAEQICNWILIKNHGEQ